MAVDSLQTLFDMGGLFGYTSQSSCNRQNKRKQSKTNFIYSTKSQIIICMLKKTN
jgi:hypothetical protein